MPTVRGVEVYPVNDLATAKASPWASVSIIVGGGDEQWAGWLWEAVSTLRVNPVIRAIEEVGG